MNYFQMDFKTELLKEHSYENSERIAWYIFDNKDTFSQLMELFWEGNNTITQRATWVIIICTEWRPKMVKPFIEPMILKLKEAKLSDSIKRNTVRILAEFPIPKQMEGEITEICFNYLNNPSEAIAIRVFSMIILERIMEKYPELIPELIESIEKGLDYGSTGFKNRGNKVLKNLQQLQNKKA
jgi:hypothetical protein